MGGVGGEVVKFDVGAGRHENDGDNHNTLCRVPCECVLAGLRCEHVHTALADSRYSLITENIVDRLTKLEEGAVQRATNRLC